MLILQKVRRNKPDYDFILKPICVLDQAQHPALAHLWECEDPAAEYDNEDDAANDARLLRPNHIAKRAPTPRKYATPTASPASRDASSVGGPGSAAHKPPPPPRFDGDTQVCRFLFLVPTEPRRIPYSNCKTTLMIFGCSDCLGVLFATRTHPPANVGLCRTRSSSSSDWTRTGGARRLMSTCNTTTTSLTSSLSRCVHGRRN